MSDNQPMGDEDYNAATYQQNNPPPNAVPYKIEHKVSHHEWDDVVFDANWLFANKAAFIDEDGFSDGYPTFEFEHGSVYSDEMWRFTETGRIYISSFSGGVVDWSDTCQCYVKSFYGSTHDLGQLVSASFTLNDRIKAILAKVTT
jgi:hypothetical protein